MLISRPIYILGAILFLGLQALNIFVWPNPLFGLILLLLGLGFFGLVIGAKIFKNWDRLEQVIWGAMLVLALVAIFLTACYYVWNLGAGAFWLSWLMPIMLGFSSAPTAVQIEEKDKNNFAKRILLFCLFAVFAIMAYFAFSVLWASATEQAIRSPWTVIAQSFFFLVFILGIVAFIFLSETKSKKSSLLILAILSFLFLSISLFVYKLGFGFDSFIHQATERYLAEHHTITPKPFYYIGQYSLVTFIHYFTNLGVNLIDKLLLPTLTVLCLPAAIFLGLKHGFGLKQKSGLLGALLFFVIPFGSLIMTTPQGLANLFALFIIFLSLSYIRGRGPTLWFLFVLALTALAIHPLSGIPVFVYLFILLFLKIKKRPIKIILTAATAILGAVSLPLVFILNSILSGTAIEITSIILKSPGILLANLNLPRIFSESHFSSLIDFVYVYGNNLAWLLPAVSVIVAVFLARKFTKFWWLGPLMFFILLVNYFFLQNTVEFSFLISYEQGAYAERVLSLAQFFLYPFFLLGLVWWLAKTWKGPWSWRVVLCLFFAGCLTASLYLSYPRHDALGISKGINVSKTDIAAVQWVERDAPNDEFIVLANQTVSAAALHEFGFKKYYDDMFYYPIPTGGQLYDYYLKMSYDAPSAATAKLAMDLVDVDYAYFIINDYWWNAEKIIEHAKLQTDSWHEIDEGKIYIFKYLR
ncbi:hypothetical protein KKD84_03905 [Patescibacteria group bacterium]|nr:hypothetical protein [Patescibacteria group bacterium]